MEVAADVDVARHAAAEAGVEEVLGALGRELAGERQHHDRVHIQLGQLGDARLVGHELLQPISREHLVGIDVEGDDGARAPLFAGRVHRLADDEAVPLVDAVEDAEGHRGAIE